MSEPQSQFEAEKKMLKEAQSKGAGATIKTYIKLSGPGWLQSAITLGGGSLAGALFLGVIGGYSMLWVQLLAMILGVIMLSAISYVTLSTGQSPFKGIREHINPVLAWGWIIASLMANMVWVLPQYSLAYGAITQNLFPSLFDNPESLGAKYTVSILILIVVTSITFFYGSKGLGIKIYETALKLVVALIVISFVGVVVKLLFSPQGLPIGQIILGFIPNPSSFFSPAPSYQEALNAIVFEPAREYWEAVILEAQRSRMIAAASAAVGINMTFLLPYSLLSKKWDKNFRGLAIFDLSTGMIVPFLIATSCVVIASASMFHGKAFDGLLIENNGKLELNSDPAMAKTVGAYNGQVSKRNAALGGNNELEEAEMKIAAMLIPRSNAQFAKSLSALVGNSTANTVFGLGVLAMGMSTISLLMLISGFVFCEIFGFEHGGWQHRLGTLAPITGLLWPFLWSGQSLVYLAIPTSVFGYVLLPVAYLTFFLMMNSKKLLGENRPQAGQRIKWNILMGISLFLTGTAAIYTAWTKSMKIGNTDIAFGKWAIILFALAVILGQIYMSKKNKMENN